MIDDGKVRRLILEAFPDIGNSNVEMEEYEYGDFVGVFVRGHGAPFRHRVDVRAKNEQEVADALIAPLREFLHPIAGS